MTYSECVFVALLGHHAMRVRRVISSLWPIRLYHIFPHCFINGTIFPEGKFIEHKMCFDSHCHNLSEWLIILRRIQRDIIINFHMFVSLSPTKYLFTRCHLSVILSTVRQRNSSSDQLHKQPHAKKFNKSSECYSLLTPFWDSLLKASRNERWKGSDCIVPPILTTGTRWRLLVMCNIRPLYPR
jgi:hypothetical protein